MRLTTAAKPGLGQAGWLRRRSLVRWGRSPKDEESSALGGSFAGLLYSRTKMVEFHIQEEFSLRLHLVSP